MIVALLPKHPFFEYMGIPSNASQLVNQLTNSFADHPLLRIIDLKNILKKQKSCQFYTDIFHFNRQDNARVSAAIIERLSIN